MRGRRAYFSDSWLCCSSPKQDQYGLDQGGPDDLPNWVLKKFSDILAAALTEVLNQSFRESKVPRIWKVADVPPVPKNASIEDFNKELRPISLTNTLSQSRGGVCYRPRTQNFDARLYEPKPVWFYTRFLHCVRTHLQATSLV